MVDKKESMDALLEKSSGTDIPILLKAKEDAKRRVKDDPSSVNLAALSRASKLLSEAMSAQSAQDGGGSFKSVAAVLAYLKEQGRKVSQAQVYKDLKRGYLRRQPDGGFKQRDVAMYASTLKAYAMPEQEADAMGDLARQELEEKVAKTREQRLSIVLDRSIKEGKYILREDVALELAARAAALAVGLRSVFRLHAVDYITLVGGDSTKAEDLAAEFEKNLDVALNDYSRPMHFDTAFVVSGSDATDVTEGQASNDDEDDNAD